MTTSALGSSLSKTDSGPSLLEVTVRRWPAFSRNLRRPSSPLTLPRSWPGVKSIALGVGVVRAARVVVDLGHIVPRVSRRVASHRVVVEHAQNMGHVESLLGLLALGQRNAKPPRMGSSTHRKRPGLCARASPRVVSSRHRLGGWPQQAAVRAEIFPSRTFPDGKTSQNSTRITIRERGWSADSKCQASPSRSG